MELQPPPPPPRLARTPLHPVPTAERMTAEATLAQGPWHRLSWRQGTKGPLGAEFAPVRVRVADGPVNSRAQHRPGEAAWLVGDRRATGETKYYLSNPPPETPLRTLAAIIKARWACEQAHQQLKEELGLDHFEGRSWTGLHHHAVLTLIALCFLQYLRLQAASRKKNSHGIPGPPPQPSLPRIRRRLLAYLQPPLYLRCPNCHHRVRHEPSAKVAK